METGYHVHGTMPAQRMAQRMKECIARHDSARTYTQHTYNVKQYDGHSHIQHVAAGCRALTPALRKTITDSLQLSSPYTLSTTMKLSSKPKAACS